MNQNWIKSLWVKLYIITELYTNESELKQFNWIESLWIKMYIINDLYTNKSEWNQFHWLGLQIITNMNKIYPN